MVARVVPPDQSSGVFMPSYQAHADHGNTLVEQIPQKAQSLSISAASFGHRPCNWPRSLSLPADEAAEIDMPSGMDQFLEPNLNAQSVAFPPPSSTVPLRSDGRPSLFESIQLRESGATPDISNAINQRLNIETSDDTSEDDYSSYETSLDEPENGKEIITGLPLARLPTGLCYDERMRYHAEVQAIEGENIHPEDPRRIYYIYKYLCEAGLVESDNGKRLRTMANPPLYRIDAREATMAECCSVHTKDHYDFIKRTQYLSNEILIEMSDETRADSIYYNQLSYFSSKLSAGGAIETCKAVMNGTVKNAIAVIRPPGHHAEVTKPMGFCMFNNVCIASRVCQQSFGERCRKILIVDWDVHHGNGCQKAFYDDPNILYISLHVHMNGNFYPSGDDGAADKVGEGSGEGMNINIPWLHKGMGDGDYMYAFQQIIMPVACEFDPDFVIVAAGFDAAAGDELGGCYVTPPCYAHMTHMLKSLAGGKIAVCLEGGYNFHAIAKSALAVTKVLMGEPPDRMGATGPSEEARRTVRQVKEIQSKYWRCLWPREPVAGIHNGEMLHDIIRQWQAMQLYDSHKLTQLHIFRNKVSRSFEQQVLATQAWDSKKNLLVIFHDPPDMLLGSRNTTEGGSAVQYDLHETWLVDPVKSLIDRAATAGFGCIDVNIPKAITPVPEDDLAIKEPQMDAADVQKHQSTLLASYIWDNYIAPSENERVFFVGIGNAFQGIARLLGDKQEVHESTAGIVAFIASNPLRPVSNENFEIRGGGLAGWYSQNSLVWVSPTHQVWKREKKLSKKFGNVVKSQETVLGLMVKKHMDEAWRWIAGRTNDSEETEEEFIGEAEQIVVDAPAEKPQGAERLSKVTRDGEDIMMDR